MNLQRLTRSSLVRRAGGIAARVLLAVLVLVALFLGLTPTGRYLVRAAWEEGKILAGRRAIVDVIADSATAEPIREKLRIVLQARAFAEDSVGLRAKRSFTAYSRLQHDTLVLVLSGAYRDRLEPYTWWFPIVGRVPYKGFFDYGAARQAARQLRDRGFDIYLRPSPAFSTLGFFNDPVLSTSLRADSIDLANTVIHELTHNTFYAAGQAVFNESFANFVGARGSAWFFRYRGQPDAADEADARWEDEKLMAHFWDTLYHAVDSAYKAHRQSAAARIAARDTVYARARSQLVYILGPQLRTIGPRVLEHVQLDNAALLARRIYLTNLDDFDGVWLREGRDLRRTVKAIIVLAKSKPKDPFGAVHAWVAAHALPPEAAP